MRTVIVCMTVMLLVVSLGTSAVAQMALGFNGIGGKIGYIMPEGDGDNTIGFGVLADLGRFTEAIHFGASIDYWSQSYDAGNWDFSYSSFIIGASANYYFPVKGAFKPYGGGGLELIMSKYEADDPTGVFDVSDSQTDIGIHLGGGVEKQLSSTLKGFAEVKYHVSDGDFFGIYAGAIYLLGK